MLVNHKRKHPIADHRSHRWTHSTVNEFSGSGRVDDLEKGEDLEVPSIEGNEP